MSKIFIPGEIDPLKRGKNCPDFVPYDDGTKVGDPKYCNLSLDCTQQKMKSDRVEITNVKGEIISCDYFCTGCYHFLGEMDPDEKAS